MRRFSNIDNEFVMNNGLSLPEAHVLEWMLNLPVWAERIVVNKNNYYFAAKNKACEDLPMVTKKLDTMYRYYKKLEKLGLINNFKINGKDYIQILPKCSDWNNIIKSDSYPGKVGQSSEFKSDKHPTNSNINPNSKLKDSSLFDQQEIQSLPKQVIQYLNETKPGKTPFQFTTTNLDLIKSRLKEGFTLDDFKCVINCKVAEWKDSPKMKKYIRPKTLFGTKFDGYVVESRDKSPVGNDGSGNFEYKPQEKAQLA